MTTKHKRNISARITMFYDDLVWTWDRHKNGFWCGFLLGVLVVVIAAEIAGGI